MIRPLFLCYFSVFIWAISENTANAPIFTATTLAPVGVERKKLMNMPTIKHTAESTPEHMTVPLNVLHSRMAVRGGKMIRLEMSKAPIMRMPSTMVTAVRQARRVLQLPAGEPVARAKPCPQPVFHLLPDRLYPQVRR
mgnify:CR=1 FL=1